VSSTAQRLTGARLCHGLGFAFCRSGVKAIDLSSGGFARARERRGESDLDWRVPVVPVGHLDRLRRWRRVVEEMNFDVSVLFA
jgi:hypothetical protein